MEEIEFLTLSKKVICSIGQEQGLIDTRPLNALKEYIQKNPNSKGVQNFIDAFFYLYLGVFFNMELRQACSLPDTLYYYRKIQIYKSLPFTIHSFWGYYIREIFDIPKELFMDFYGSFLYVLKKYRASLSDDKHILTVVNFVRENETLMRGYRDSYYNLNDEIALYYRAERRENFSELEEFRTQMWSNDYEAVRRFFMNKRIGNIGEEYVYVFLWKYSSIFVARDVKNGFGYDIYFYDADNIENLVEVKTTMLTLEQDSFNVSESEYREMKRCLGNPHARYVICRVRLNSSFVPTYAWMTLKDEETLVDMNNPQVEYKLESSTTGMCFREQKIGKRFEYRPIK